MVMSKGGPAPELAAHCLELFEALGGVQARLVFGEHAFFRDGVMFALIWDGALYVRVDAATRARHEALGLKPFVYVNRDGRGIAMPYFEVPASALDDEAEMLEWARPATAAALIAARSKSKSKTGAKKASAKKVSGKKVSGKKVSAKKASAKKAGAKKASAKKASAKKAGAKKSSAKKR